jgi:type IV pilus assembly protein PilX
MNTPTHKSPHHQRGVVLIVALLFLVVLTILGTAASRMVTSEERMSRFAREYNIAFQAAEAALRDARDIVNPLSRGNVQGQQSNLLDKTSFTPECQFGLCKHIEGVTPWKDASKWNQAIPYGTYSSRSPLPKSGTVGKDASDALDDSGSIATRYDATTRTAGSSGVFDQPKFLIEVADYEREGVEKRFGQKDNIYRITALGFGADPNTRAMVQEVFLPPIKPTE